MSENTNVKKTEGPASAPAAGSIPICPEHGLPRIHVLGCKQCVEQSGMSQLELMLAVAKNKAKINQQAIDRLIG